MPARWSGRGRLARGIRLVTAATTWGTEEPPQTLPTWAVKRCARAGAAAIECPADARQSGSGPPALQVCGPGRVRPVCERYSQPFGDYRVLTRLVVSVEPFAAQLPQLGSPYRRQIFAIVRLASSDVSSPGVARGTGRGALRWCFRPPPRVCGAVICAVGKSTRLMNPPTVGIVLLRRLPFPGGSPAPRQWGGHVFHSVAPALRSRCIAAVRSATVGRSVSARPPFTDGHWLLAHNGVVDRPARRPGIGLFARYSRPP